MNRTGFVVALPDELTTLTKQRVDNGACRQRPDGTLVALSGAGHGNARRAAHLLLEKGATLLVSWGCAAALDRGLTPGCLVLPEWVQTEEGRQYPAAARWHRVLCDRLSEFMPVYTGLLVESKRLVSDSAAKRTLAAIPHSAALDMESAAVAEVASRYCVPFLAVRAIADPLDMSLPGAVAHALDDNGTVVLHRLFKQLVRRPGEIPELIRLCRQFRKAQQTLLRVADLTQDLLSRQAPSTPRANQPFI